MNNILALDSSSNACSVALMWQGELMHRWELAPRGHMQRLLPMVDELLQAAGVNISQLEAIAFGRGPGSFTGLRVAAGIVQGLAWGADLPVVPVSTLAALAQSLKREQPNLVGRLGVAVDARMDEIYGACFELDELKLIGEEFLLPQAQAASAYPGIDLAVGSGWAMAPLAALRPPVYVDQAEPHALDILTLACSGNYGTVPAEQAAPVYLRDSVSWQKRTRIRTQAL